MNRHLEKIMGDAKDIRNQFWGWYREQPAWRQWAEAIGAVLLVIVLARFAGSGGTPSTLEKANPVVRMAPVSELANTDTELPLLGTVTSTSEATILSESSGKLTRVYKKLGDYVTAGQVIAEFENSAERAAVLQAEGAYDAAKASRDIARINSGTTKSSLYDAETNALTAISSAYNAMDDSVRVKTDTYYGNPRFQDVHFLPSVPDARLVYTLEDERRSIEKMLVARDARNRTLSINSDLATELNTVQIEVQTVKTYLDDLFLAISKAVPDANYSQSQLDAAKTTVSGARSAIAATITSVTGSRAALKSSLSAQEIAGKTTGDISGNVTTADASVKQALGTYDAALARLEKTIVRSPISGTLNSLSIETGDFIPAFSQVAVVSNNSALEVVAYVTEEDAKRVRVGSPVVIDAAAKGVITRVASAIDPRTKKIEVRVGITDKNTTLVNGQSVRVTITKEKTAVSATSGPITIPLSALKLTPNGAYVFTLSSTSSLIAIPVEDGAILGDKIQIVSGLNGTESIVTDARGLKEGMAVTIKE